MSHATIVITDIDDSYEVMTYAEDDKVGEFARDLVTVLEAIIAKAKEENQKDATGMVQDRDTDNSAEEEA